MDSLLLWNPLGGAATPWEQQPHKFLPFLLPCEPIPVTSLTLRLRHQAFLCRSKHPPSLTSPSTRAPLNAQIQTTKSLTHAIPRRQSQQLTFTSTKSSYRALGVGVGGAGAGGAPFQNRVFTNWKEPADDPRLKGSFGDLKNKTIRCDLGIYKNGGGGAVARNQQQPGGIYPLQGRHRKDDKR